MNKLSANDRKALKRIKKRGRAETVPVALNEYVKAGETQPDGQGGYVVEYYVISEKGEKYLQRRKKRFLFAVKRIFAISKPIIEVAAAIGGFLLLLLEFLKDSGS